MITHAFEQAKQLYNDTDGILVCDKYGYIELAYWGNGIDLPTSEAEGRHITEAYPELDEQTSTIMRTLATGEPSYDERQVIHNFRGDLLDIVTSTLPLFNKDELVGAMTASISYEKYRKLIEKKDSGKSSLYILDDIISQDPTVVALKERCRMIADNDSPVLLYGETGTGKELFAQSLHTSSKRAKKPFISQNCAAIPESLLEGIFFGSEKGSFTGAETRKGLFEMADGGTLFLDEINSMELSMQAKLLKAIEEQRVRHLGGLRDIPFDARIICAMNQEPMEVLKNHQIREDLFYRISVVRIDIPPLRNRKNDIMILTDYFIRHYNQKFKRNIQGVSELVKMTFQNYNWKGNVRELKNTIEGIFNICTGTIINMGDIPNIMQKNSEDEDVYINNFLPLKAHYDYSCSLQENVQAYEKSMIERALKNAASITDAARMLKISRQCLSYKIEKYNIKYD